MFIKCENVNGDIIYINFDMVAYVKPIGDSYILCFVDNCKWFLDDDCSLLVKSKDLIELGIV